MASRPIPRSYSSILGGQVASFISKTGISKIKVGGPILSLLESVSQSQLRSSGDIFQLLAAQNLSSATGSSLQAIGNSENVPILGARSAGGFVTISDTSFVKKATQVYQGKPAPVVGTLSLNVIDASAFPASGSIYIGRGTANFEGPLAYTAKTDNTSYWTLTLSAGTTRFHNLNEPVVLSQGGNRSITAGSLVQTPTANSSQSVQFRTLNSVILPDGETSLANVAVVAQRAGEAGNVGAGDIQSFVTTPFTGATATNPTSFTNGRETENDDDYRDRIRVARQTRVKGTKLAVTSSVLGIFDATENKSVASSSYVVRLGAPDTLYIDDGSGYEEVAQGVAQDVLLAVATGGEQCFQVNSALPITKAFLETSVDAPFALKDGSSLSVLVGDTVSEHSFGVGDFRDIGSATAFEVVASINGNGNLLYAARPSSNGTKVVIFSKASIFEYLNILSIDNNANDALGFPLIKAETLRLFKNDQLLTKDGSAAVLYSDPFGQWGTLLGSQTLTLAIDGTPATTYTFVDSDFVSLNTGYLAVGTNSLDAWILVLNSKIPGVTFSKSFGSIQVRSNKGNSTAAVVDIQGGSLVTNGVFATARTVGQNNDYQFDRNIGQIKLTTSLQSGDTLVAGSSATRAFVESPILSTVTLGSTGKLWVGVDSPDYQIINTGLVTTSALTTTLESDKVYWGYPVRITSLSPIFSNVQKGDLAIIWDAGITTSLHGTWRVFDAAPTWFEIGKANTAAKRRMAASVALADGRVFVTGGYASETTGTGTTTTISLRSCEIFDPAALTWTPAGSMTYPRSEHTATLLADGKVFVSGGVSSGSVVLFDEVYDPSTNLWSTVTSLASTEARYGHVATLLTAGPNANRVLIAGGFTASYATTCWIYNPAADTWAATGALTAGRIYAASCNVPGGDFLVVGGGAAGATVLATAERYDKTLGTWSSAGSASSARYGGRMIYSTTSSRAEYYGGNTVYPSGPANDVTTLDRYNDVANTWAVGASSTTKRAFHPWVLASGGKAFAYGGFNSSTRSEVYDSGANTWSQASIGPYDGLNYRYALGNLVAGNKVLISHGSHPPSTGTEINRTSYAVSTLYNATGNTWSATDPSVDLSLSLTQGGISFIRSKNLPELVTVPSAANYTATSFASTLTPLLKGAVSSTFNTNQLRVSTNTFAESVGSVGVMSANASGQLLGIVPSDPVNNIVGANGSTESGSSEIDFAFKVAMRVPGRDSVYMDVFNGETLLDSSYNMLFNKHQTSFGGTTNDTGATFFAKSFNYGSSFGYYDQIVSQVVNRKVPLRSFPEVNIIADEWVSAMLPYRFTWQDSLNVLVDQDIASKNYQSKMARKLQTQGTTYATTSTFKDADNSNASLAVGFGFGANSFDFKDFAIAMPSRVLVDSADATRRLLWRWSRIGSDGDGLRLEYILPATASATPTVAMNYDTVSGISDPVIQVSLSSGAPISLSTFNSSLGLGVAALSTTNGLSDLIFVSNLVAASGSLTTNVVTLTLTLPAGVTNHGLTVGTGICYSGDTGVVFPAGNYSISAVTPTTISFPLVSANVGVTALVAAKVSQGTAIGDFTGLAANDLFRMNSSAVSAPGFADRTYRINAMSGTFNYFHAVDRASYGYSIGTTLTWAPINSVTNVTAFTNGSDTVTTLASYFTTGIIKATVTGTGAGTITKNTAEFVNDGTFYYTLTDGVQYVSSVATPALISDNYIFTFKNPIAATLATNSDWANETVYAIPVTAKNCANWLSSETVSGLANTCEVKNSTRGTKVQITTNTPGSSGSTQVKGGTANTATATVIGQPIVNSTRDDIVVKTAISDLAGFTGQSAVLVQNSNVLARPSSFTSATVVSSVSVNGNFFLDYSAAGDFGTFSNTGSVQLSFQKVGKYVLMSIADSAVVNFQLSDNVKEGDWISIQTNPVSGNTPTISSANCGLFRIIKTDSINSVLYENPNYVEETLVYGWVAKVKDSYVLPGDTFAINTSVLGNINSGTRKVLSVGKGSATVPVGGISKVASVATVTAPTPHGFRTGDYVYVSPGESSFALGWRLVTGATTFTFTFAETAGTASNTVQQSINGLEFQNNKILTLDNSLLLSSYTGATSLGSDYLNISATEGSPAKLYKFIKNVIDTTAVRLSPASYSSYISEAAGSSLTAIGKFDFSNAIFSGLDGYAHSTGIIAESSKILYGDEEDPATYPGVVSAGNSVEISGPLIKRLLIGVSVRIKTGVAVQSIVNKTKAAVASVVNASGVGEDISFSDIIDAINKIVGIVAVVIDYPAYNSSNDVITVQNYEKALVLDAQSDVQVSIIGG